MFSKIHFELLVSTLSEKQQTSHFKINVKKYRCCLMYVVYDQPHADHRVTCKGPDMARRPYFAQVCHRCLEIYMAFVNSVLLYNSFAAPKE